MRPGTALVQAYLASRLSPTAPPAHPFPLSVPKLRAFIARDARRTANGRTDHRPKASGHDDPSVCAAFAGRSRTCDCLRAVLIVRRPRPAVDLLHRALPRVLVSASVSAIVKESISGRVASGGGAHDFLSRSSRTRPLSRS